MIVRSAEDIGNTVKQRRIDMELTQSTLADRLGVTRQWISRLEKGRHDITLDRLLALIKALNMTIDLRAIHTDSSAESGVLPKSTMQALNRHFAENLDFEPTAKRLREFMSESFPEPRKLSESMAQISEQISEQLKRSITIERETEDIALNHSKQGEADQDQP